ncbi:MAG TPA: hypothetical protein PKM21_11395 [Anaerolineales bacterium]|nr:hypothetical protein [Anaerolineales bacterium]
MIAFFFSSSGDKAHPRLGRAYLLALALAGALLWCLFFNWGDVPMHFMDWAEVWGARMQAWRNALLHNTLPFHLNDLGAMRSANDRYFAVADMVSSPQVLLLRWLEVGPYALVNNLLLYALATWHLLQIRKRYALSLFTFSALFLIFHFNGFIVTHLAVGHLSWGGYYLFPAFVLLLLDLVEGRTSWRWVAGMALTLFLIFMQGSFHHLVWCFIALGSLAVLRPPHFFPAAQALLFSLLLSMPRLLPALRARFASLSQGLDFLGGYPSLADLLRALVYPSSPQQAMPRLLVDSSLGYWEFDLFTGWVGLLFLLFGLGALAWWHARARRFPYLLVPALLLIILSIADAFPRLLFHSPLAASERATSRLAGLALVILLILAAIYAQKALQALPSHPALALLQAGLLILLAYQLARHTLGWSVVPASLAFEVTPRDLSLVHIANRPDPNYYLMLGGGLLVSICSGALLCWLARRTPRAAADLPIPLDESATSAKI